ncbi:hypothetical protein F2P79_007242 [Pimephales promelas]|nr:hypothetical protein F2P79_007242 [Pimephales promelas]
MVWEEKVTSEVPEPLGLNHHLALQWNPPSRCPTLHQPIRWDSERSRRPARHRQEPTGRFYHSSPHYSGAGSPNATVTWFPYTGPVSSSSSDLLMDHLRGTAGLQGAVQLFMHLNFTHTKHHDLRSCDFICETLTTQLFLIEREQNESTGHDEALLKGMLGNSDMSLRHICNRLKKTQPKPRLIMCNSEWRDPRISQRSPSNHSEYPTA